MSAEGNGKDGDQDRVQREAHGRRPGALEPLPDHRLQYRYQFGGMQAQNATPVQLHAMVSFPIPEGHNTAFLALYEMPETVQPIFTAANRAGQARFNERPVQDPRELQIPENNNPAADFVRRELQPPPAHMQLQPPVAHTQPQTGHNLANIYGGRTFTRDPIPPLGQMMGRGPYSAVSHTPTPFAPKWNGPRMQTIQQQAKYPAEVSSVHETRPLYGQVTTGNPTGGQGQEGKQAPESPVSYVLPARAQGHEAKPLLRPPVLQVGAPNFKQQAAASTPKYTAQINTHQGKMATATQIPSTPATGTQSMLSFPPMQQQQAGYAIQQNESSHMKYNMAGANYDGSESSRSLPGMNQFPRHTFVTHGGDKADPNSNEETKRRLFKQTFAVPTSHQSPFTPTTTSNVPTQVVRPVNSVTGSQRVNYPNYANFPLQGRNTASKAGSTFGFTNTLEQNSRVNVGLQQQGSFPICDANNNTQRAYTANVGLQQQGSFPICDANNNTQGAYTAGYNIPGTAWQMLTAGDTPKVSINSYPSVLGVLQGDEREARLAQLQEVYKIFVSEPKYHSTLRLSTKLVLSNWVPSDETEMCHFERALVWLDKLPTNVRGPCICPELNFPPEKHGETRTKYILVCTLAYVYPERDEGSVQAVILQQQALHPICNLYIPGASPFQWTLYTATGSQVSRQTGVAAAIHTNAYEQLRRRLCAFYTHLCDDSDDCDLCQGPLNGLLQRGRDMSTVDPTEERYFIVFDPLKYENIFTRIPDTTNVHRDASFAKGAASGAFLEKNNCLDAMGSQRGVGQPTSSPADMRGENRYSAGPTLPQGLWSRAEPEAARSLLTHTDRESTPEAVYQQHPISETHREKRKLIFNELSTPRAKKQMMVRQGTELQSAPSSTTLRPHQDYSYTRSVKEGTGDDALKSGALSVTTGNISCCSIDKTCACCSVENRCGCDCATKDIDRHPSKDNESEVTTDEETVDDTFEPGVWSITTENVSGCSIENIEGCDSATRDVCRYPSKDNESEVTTDEETVGDALESGAWSISTENVSGSSIENIEGCDSTTWDVDGYPSKEGNQTDETTSDSLETVLDVVQEPHCVIGESHGKGDAVLPENENATERNPEEIMAVSKQMSGTSSENTDDDSGETSSSSDDSDFYLESDESETQSSEDDNERECGNIESTVIPSKQQAKGEKSIREDAIDYVDDDSRETYSSLHVSMGSSPSLYLSRETSPHADQDCHMKFDETETQKAEDEDKRGRDSLDGSCVTDSPEQQHVPEVQKDDCPRGVPQAGKDDSISEKHKREADVTRDSGLSDDRKVVADSSSIEECARLLNETKLLFQSIKETFCAAPVKQSASESTPTVQARQLQSGYGARVQHQVGVETQNSPSLYLSRETSPHADQDCHMKFDETETHKAEDEDKRGRNSLDGSCVTDSPEKQHVPEVQKDDRPRGIPQTGKDESISEKHKRAADVIRDPGLPDDRKVVAASSSTKECARLINEAKLFFQSTMHTFCATPVIQLASDSTPTVQAQQSQSGYGASVQHQDGVETQNSNGNNTVNVHPIGSMEANYEILLAGDEPKTTFSPSSISSTSSTSSTDLDVEVCQITDISTGYDGRTILEITSGQDVGGYDVDDEEDESECESVGGEDSCGNERASHCTKDIDMDNDIVCNQMATPVCVTSTVEDETTTEGNKEQPKEEDDRNTPPEDD